MRRIRSCRPGAGRDQISASQTWAPAEAGATGSIPLSVVADQDRVAVVLSARIDHLVLACADLAQGARYVRERLGVEPQPGGRHLLMGTHNALLKLGPRVYLELIAIDPHGAAQRPRWFALDAPAVRERMARGPFLLAWVARTGDIDAAVAALPALGRILSLSRGAFRWRIAVPDDGSVDFDGMMPTLIQWEGDAHPADGLAEAGCELLRLQVSHPQADALAERLQSLGVAGSVELDAGPARLAAQVASPRGVVELC
jgi:catechol 2,3-dioxygenase-like lactoylglutathione lyase family enzyme